MLRPTWFDWITFLAILLGPVFAILTQMFIEWLSAQKKQRIEIYKTLMALRASPLHPDHIRALNSLDSIFDRISDKPVRDAWTRLLEHVTQGDANTQAWQDTLVDRRVDVYQAVGKAVGYDHSVDYIKRRIYAPTYFSDMELEQMVIRKNFAKAITEQGLKVVLTESQRK
jgi:predicted outer membrane lipoprotein